MSGKTRVRSSAPQLKMLIDYMASHLPLAKGKFTGYQGKLREQRQWEDLRMTLKDFGPDKTVEQWKTTWRDLRRKARTEGSIASQTFDETGNTTAVPELSDMNRKILEIMGTEGSVSISGDEESGVGPSTKPERKVTTANKEASKYNVQRVMRPSTGTRSWTHITNVRNRQQEMRARVKQFPQPDLETNNILRDFANQFEIANRINASRVRLTYKEKLWRLRRDIFK